MEWFYALPQSILIIVAIVGSMIATLIAVTVFTNFNKMTKRFISTFNNHPEPAVLFHVSGDIKKMNEKAKVLIHDGVTFDSWHRVAEEDRFKVLRAFQRAATGRSRTVLFSFNTLRDGQIWLKTSFVPLKHRGRVTSIYTTSTNVTEREKLNHQLRIEKQEAEKYLNIASVFVVVLNEQFEVTTMNQKGLGIIGVQEQEIYGKPWESFVLSDEWNVCKAILKERLSQMNQKAFTQETTIMTNDGDERLIRWEFTCIFDEMGKKKIICSGEDITHWRQMENELKRSQVSLAETQSLAKVGSWEYDIGTKKLNISSAMYDLIENGTPPSEFDIDQFISLLHPDDREKIEHFLTNAYHMAMYEAFDFRLLRNDEYRYFYGEVRSKVNQLGRPKQIYGIIQDITESKKLEIQFRQATKAKSEFLANMSHEIRTPINTISGASYLLQKMNLDEAKQLYVTKIQTASELLLEMVNSILDFSKIEAGKVDLDYIPFSIHTLLQEVMHIVSWEAERKKIHLSFYISPNIPTKITGDSVKIKQVLTNLINNAIKFTDKGYVKVNIDCEYDELIEEVQIRFTVKDSGIGLTEFQKDHLFEKFMPSDESRDRKKSGTGLGLAICQQLVSLMGGYFHVESQLDVGSTFSFVIPFYDYAKYPLMLEEHEPSDRMALIIDRDKEFGSFVKESLTSLFKTVVVAENSQDGLRYLKQNNESIELILLDWQTDTEHSHIFIDQWHYGEKSAATHLLVTHSNEFKPSLQIEDPKVNFMIKPFDNVSLHFMIKSLRQKKYEEKEPIVSLRQSKKMDDIRTRTRRHSTNILIVEDHEVNRLILKSVLEETFETVIAAEDGLNALRLLETYGTDYFDLVLLDIQMPHMNGYELCERLKMLNPALPIVAVTAHAFVAEREKCHLVGMDGFLTKPIDPVELIYTIEQLLELSHDETEFKQIDLNRSSSSQHIQFDLLLELLQGKKTLALEVLEIFRTEYEDITLRLDQHIAQDELEIARIELHNLKGTASNLKITTLSNLAHSLEEAMKQNKTGDIIRIKQELKTIISLVFREIDQLNELSII